MLKKLSFDSLSGKIALILLLNVIITATVSLVGFSSINSANDNAINIHDSMNVPARRISDSFRFQILSHIQILEAAQLTGPEKEKRIILANQLRELGNASYSKVLEQSYHPDVQTLINEYSAIRKKYKQGYQKLNEAKQSGNIAAISSIIENDVRPHGIAMAKKINIILQSIDSLVEKHHEHGISAHDSVIVILMLIGSIGLAGNTLLGIGALRSMNKSIHHAQSSITKLANGQFNNPIETTGPKEISGLLKSMESMRILLSKTIIKITENSAFVQSASTQMSAGNSDLAKRTQNQAASLEETTTAMSRMTKTVRQNAADAKEASRLADLACNRATESGEVVNRTVHAMSELNSSSAKVVDIVSLIDEISFQTNLLALNAAVEAARAGEQGRGFAVVASEVRNLAQRSATAAQEIKVLIEDSSNKVKASSQLVNESGETLRDIIKGIEEVTSLNSRISKASNEQANGIEEVNISMAEMERVTHANAALVEQAAVTSEELDSRARELERQVEFFNTKGAIPSPNMTNARTNDASPLFSV